LARNKNKKNPMFMVWKGGGKKKKKQRPKKHTPLGPGPLRKGGGGLGF